MLTELEIKNAKPREKPYKMGDGKGLYVEVMPTGAKYWRLKYCFAGKEKRLSMGVYQEVTLKTARNATLQARVHLANGIGPERAAESAQGESDSSRHEQLPGRGRGMVQQAKTRMGRKALDQGAMDAGEKPLPLARQKTGL